MEAPKVLIKPAVGRVVWYYPGGTPQRDAGMQPMAATIAYVHSDQLINIGYIDHDGQHGERTSIYLMADPDGTPPPDVISYCTWMPYQMGQAARTQEVAKLLDIGSGG